MAEEIHLLHRMISDRTSQLETLQLQLEALQNDLDHTEIQTSEAQRLYDEDVTLHRQRIVKYDMEKQSALEEMIQLERQAKESASLHEYVRLLTEVRAAQRDAASSASSSLSLSDVAPSQSTYILRLEAQLMKVMHVMGIQDNVRRLYEGQCDQMVKSLREEIGQTVDVASEVRMMNELGELHRNMKAMEEEYERKIEAVREECRGLDAELEEIGWDGSVGTNSSNSSSSSSSNNDEDDDGEGNGTSRKANGDEDEDDNEDDACKSNHEMDRIERQIELLSHEVEALSAENQRTEHHLKNAIAEKDEILDQLRAKLDLEAG